MHPRSFMAYCTWQVSGRLALMERCAKMNSLYHLMTSSNSVSFTQNVLDTLSMDTPQASSAPRDRLARVLRLVLVWP